MPRINIDWIETGKTQKQRDELAEKITQDVVEIGKAAPEKVMLAFIEHSPGKLFQAGRVVNNEIVRVYVEWVEGRTQEQRDKLAERVTESIANTVNVDPKNITVKFEENEMSKMYKKGKTFKR
jgi:phenylpyruvate tautomerase PptA (4-oxalocrotonate tautomerase family)